MVKITNADEVKKVESIVPEEVTEVIKYIAATLDNTYGVLRNANDDGGYVVIIESKEDFEKLKEIYIDVDDLIPEYVDKITCSNGEIWTNTLVLMNNDFGVSILCNLETAPKAVLDEICGEE